jgi:glycosyltransferase involved in cell wall biosynthesis
MIAALIMVKNEEKSIEVTLNSIKNHIKHVIVYDTGSTDNTINIIKNTCEKNNQTLYLKNGTFTPLKI